MVLWSITLGKSTIEQQLNWTCSSDLWMKTKIGLFLFSTCETRKKSVLLFNYLIYWFKLVVYIENLVIVTKGLMRIIDGIFPHFRLSPLVGHYVSSGRKKLATTVRLADSLIRTVFVYDFSLVFWFSFDFERNNTRHTRNTLFSRLDWLSSFGWSVYSRLARR